MISATGSNLDLNQDQKIRPLGAVGFSWVWRMSDEQRYSAVGGSERRDDVDDRRFRQIFEANPGAVVVVDESGIIELANAEAGRVFGYAPGELLGRPIEILIADRPHSDFRAALLSTAHQRPLGAGRDIYARYKNGTQFLVEVGTKSIATPAGTKTLIAIVDVSGRKSRETGADAAASEKDVQLREAHHRARSNLQIVQSLLDWQSPRIKDRAAAELLRESQNRISSIAMIHQMLSQARNSPNIDFHMFLAQLVPALVSSYGGDANRINVKMSANGLSLPSKSAVPCGLLITELVSNSLKHAFAGASGGTIEIALVRTSGQQHQLSIADDGVGIPDRIAIDNAATTGLQLVGLIAKQLKAEMAVRKSGPTRFDFRFDVTV
jgi:PAS domain S-box-containing protein